MTRSGQIGAALEFHVASRVMRISGGAVASPDLGRRDLKSRGEVPQMLRLGAGGVLPMRPSLEAGPLFGSTKSERSAHVRLAAPSAARWLGPCETTRPICRPLS